MYFHSINFIKDICLFAIRELRILFYANFPSFKAKNDLIRLISPQYDQETPQTVKSTVIPNFLIVPTGARMTNEIHDLFKIVLISNFNHHQEALNGYQPREENSAVVKR